MTTSGTSRNPDRERSRRLLELYRSASGLGETERAACLDRVAAEAPDLRDDLERLLSAERDVQADGFLTPPPDNLQSLLGDDASEPNVGRRIGPYELIEPLGAGGMGSVYLAARRDDYRQLVAIKLVKRGMDTDEVVRRFQYERQTLAGLSHPNIARLLDGGTDNDLPYFVMEYVDGLRIDEHCDRHRLSIEQRVELFAEVCAAVGYAHANVVVHRDLKPANILVTADSVPKLLDFGLARLLSPPLDVGLLDPTRARDRFLTASYASPEQIQGDTVGKPSDVYALGVILYELLAARKPLPTSGRPTREIERMISFETPAPPSVAARHAIVRRHADGRDVPMTAEAIATERATTASDLTRRLRGDLDNIVMMALRKEPRSRYADGGEMGSDLRRWLGHEPIRARRESLAYVTGKFVRRHRLLVAATTTVILVLAGGLVASLTALKYAFEQRDRAREAGIAEVRAELEVDDLRRESLARTLAASVMFELYDDPELNLLLAMEAVAQKPTAGAEHALRVALARTKPGTLLAGHVDVVDDAIFSPDGRRVVSVSEDGTARVWEARTGEEIATMRGHDGPVLTAAFSPDGTVVATAGEDGTARTWDAATGAERLRLTGEAPILHVSFSPDGAWLITSDEGGAVRLWDAGTGEEREVVHRAPAAVGRVLFSPDGERIVEGSSDRTGRVIHAETGKELATLVGHRGRVADATFDADGTRIVTASDDQTARIWDVDTGDELVRLHGHHAPVRSAAFSPDGRFVVTASADETVRVWDADTGECLRIEGGHAATFSPDGAWLVVARQDDTAHVLAWELFAPLADNLEEARRRVTRSLTPAERDRYVRELTAEEKDALLRDPPEALRD
ncbi:MAG: WD40 repeat domain-containing serine/threonine protein kinase [Planctomycetota bacterium]|jgi:serine/threonine protein kinase